MKCIVKASLLRKVSTENFYYNKFCKNATACFTNWKVNIFWKAAVLKILFKQKHLRTPLQHRRKLFFSVKLSSALNLNSAKRWTHLSIFFWVFRLFMIVVICRYWYNLNKWHSRKQNIFKVFVDRNTIQMR